MYVHMKGHKNLLLVSYFLILKIVEGGFIFNTATNGKNPNKNCDDLRI